MILPGMTDDTLVDNQALLDDIFGIDSDDDFDVVTNVVDATDQPTVEVEPVAEPVLRRSARNHKPGRWEKRYVGLCTCQRDVLSRTYIFNMTIAESISKYGDTAVDSIDKEMRQMCEKHVWEGVMSDSLTPKQVKGIITSVALHRTDMFVHRTFGLFSYSAG
jgi:hypothetical protein